MAEAVDRDQIAILKRAFTLFETEEGSGRIAKDKVRTILDTLGHSYEEDALEAMLQQEPGPSLDFDTFANIAIQFFADLDDERLQRELKDAFRLYDKEGNGFIPISSLREILVALDDQLTPEQLDEMIAEIDTDASGTVDFDEFIEMMTKD